MIERVTHKNEKKREKEAFERSLEEWKKADDNFDQTITMMIKPK
jgi:hypothetical protein